MFFWIFLKISISLLQNIPNEISYNANVNNLIPNNAQPEKIPMSLANSDDITKALNRINYYRTKSKLFSLKLSAITSHQSMILAQSLYSQGSKQIPTFPTHFENIHNLNLTLGKSICIEAASALDSITLFFKKLNTRHFLLNPKLYSIGIAFFDGIAIISETGMLEPGKYTPDYVAFPGPSIYTLNDLVGFEWSFELIPDRLTNIAYVQVKCRNETMKIRRQTVTKHIISFELEQPLIANQTYDVLIHDIFQFKYSVTIQNLRSHLSTFRSIIPDTENELQYHSVEDDATAKAGGPDLTSKWFCIGKMNRCMAISQLYVYYTGQIIDNTTLLSILEASELDDIQVFITQNTDIFIPADLYIMKHVSFISDPSVISRITITDPIQEFEVDDNVTEFMKFSNIHELSFRCSTELLIPLLNISRTAFSNKTVDQRNITVLTLLVDFETYVSNSQTIQNTFLDIANFSIDGGNQLTNVVFLPGLGINISNKADYIDPGFVFTQVTLPVADSIYILSNRRLTLTSSIELRFSTNFRPVDILIRTDYPAIEFDGTWIPQDPPIRIYIYEGRQLEFSGKTIPKNIPDEVYYFQKMENDPWVATHNQQNLLKTIIVGFLSIFLVTTAFSILFYLTYAKKKRKYTYLEEHAEEDEFDFSEGEHNSNDNSRHSRH